MSRRLLKRILRNKYGFSITEVLVAAGMLGVVSLGLMQMTGQQGKSQKKMRIDFNVTTLLYDLSAINKNQDACENTLSTIAASGDLTSLPRNITLKDQRDNNLLVVGQEIGNGTGGAVTVERIRVTGSTPAIVTGGSSQAYNLIITADFTKNGVTDDSREFSKSITVGFIDNDGDGVVDFSAGDSCNVENLSKSVICESLGGVVVRVNGQDRCANIDLYNIEADPGTIGESDYFGVMARGGLAILEDDGTATHNRFWSITATDTARSELNFRRNSTTNPADSSHEPILSLQSRTDGTGTDIVMNSEEYRFRNQDGSTTSMMFGAQGGIGIGAIPDLSTTGALLEIRPFDELTQDAIRIQTNVQNADLFFTARGTIDAEGSLYFKIDPDNVRDDNTDQRRYNFVKDGVGDAGTRLMSIEENGRVAIGANAPESTSNLEINRTDLFVNMRVRTDVNNGNPGLRLRNGDQNWLVQNQGVSNDELWFYDESIGRLRMKIGKTGGVLIRNSPDAAPKNYALAPSGALDVWDGPLYLYRTYDEIGNQGTGTCQANSPGQTACKVVNRGWVYHWFAGNVTGAIPNSVKQDIINNLLNTSGATGANWLSLRDNAEAHVFDAISVSYVSGLSGGVACPSGQFVEKLRYIDPGTFQFQCGNPLGCGTKENCSRVYAGTGGAGSVCIRNGAGNYQCLSHGQVTTPVSCNNRDSGTGLNSARTATCNSNEMVRSFRIMSDGRIRLLCCNNRILN